MDDAQVQAARNLINALSPAWTVTATRVFLNLWTTPWLRLCCFVIRSQVVTELPVQFLVRRLMLPWPGR